MTQVKLMKNGIHIGNVQDGFPVKKIVKENSPNFFEELTIEVMA